MFTCLKQNLSLASAVNVGLFSKLNQGYIKFKELFTVNNYYQQGLRIVCFKVNIQFQKEHILLALNLRAKLACTILKKYR